MRLLLLLALAMPAQEAPAPSVFQPVKPVRAAALRDLGVDLFRLTSVTNAGDDRLFLTQQNGLLHVFDGKLPPEPFLDLRSVVSTGGERGLLSAAFHPEYSHNGLLFVAYTDLENALAIARYHVSADPDRADAASGKVVLRIPKKYQEHNGGQIHFGPDGYLYLSVGDGGSEGHVGGDPECVAQQGSTLFGKILRLDVDRSENGKAYAIPADNPFRGNSGTSGMPAEVWALGLRNPWRFSFDRLKGDLYIGDVGEDLREEIDFQPAGSPGGRNFGWKVMEGSTCFSTAACPAATPPCGSPAYTPPILEYGHEDGRCSVTGGFVYRGTGLPHLHGAYVFGDQCNGQLWAAERKGSTLEVHELPLRALYVTSFGEDRKGEIHLTTLDGRLHRLTAPHPVDTVALWEPATARLLLKDLHVSGPEDRVLRLGSRARGTIPLAGDWDGDGRTSLGLYEPKSGLFRLKGTPESSDLLLTFHPSAAGRNAVPLAGDWDGDGKDSVGFYEPKTSTFELKNTYHGDRAELSFRFGPPRNRWLPITGDWDGDGKDGVGFYDPVQGVFRLKNRLV
ncbi:MAG TPA: PQQ-dependent sugar dehydrogenase, partial [Thermoanaerobaculia bacterium]|nr:PQQ-dependent sugar dehydrogenase [Thermoanaerobaculia bacterium]